MASNFLRRGAKKAVKTNEASCEISEAGRIGGFSPFLEVALYVQQSRFQSAETDLKFKSFRPDAVLNMEYRGRPPCASLYLLSAETAPLVESYLFLPFSSPHGSPIGCRLRRLLVGHSSWFRVVVFVPVNPIPASHGTSQWGSAEAGVTVSQLSFFSFQSSYD